MSRSSSQSAAASTTSDEQHSRKTILNTTTDPIMPSTIQFSALPALGAELDGGHFYGITTLKDGTHAAVILLPNKAQEHMGWKDAAAWAAEAGGQLPSRPVAALLYANAKDQFEETWYWTDETCSWNASYAWHCHFYNGYQFSYRESAEGAAVAVRLIHLIA